MCSEWLHYPDWRELSTGRHKYICKASSELAGCFQLDCSASESVILGHPEMMEALWYENHFIVLHLWSRESLSVKFLLHMICFFMHKLFSKLRFIFSIYSDCCFTMQMFHACLFWVHGSTPRHRSPQASEASTCCFTPLEPWHSVPPSAEHQPIRHAGCLQR